MPVVKLAATKDGRKLANYLQRDPEGHDRAVFVSENDRGKIERVNSAQHAEKDFQSVRERFEKTDGVQAHMAYISFKKDDLGDLAKPDGKPDWEKIEAFTHEYAKRAGIAEKYQYYAVAHDDKANPHVHLVWNAVSDKDGSKYHSAKNENIDRMRDVANELSREHGIKYRFEQERNPEKVPDAIIRGVQNGAPPYSWKRDLQERVKKAAVLSDDFREFKERLNKAGVNVRERGSGLSYDFKDYEDKKHVIRAARLGAAYTRKDMERRFAYSGALSREIDTAQDARAVYARIDDNIRNQKEHFTSWQQELRSAFKESERRAHSPEEFRQLARERGLTVEKNPEGRYELRYHDRFGTEHQANADVLRKGTTDQMLQAKIERTSENQLHRTESAAPAQAIGAATRSVDSVSQAITREIERNSNADGPYYHGPERRMVFVRTGAEDGMKSHEGLDGEDW